MMDMGSCSFAGFQQKVKEGFPFLTTGIKWFFVGPVGRQWALANIHHPPQISFCTK